MNPDLEIARAAEAPAHSGDRGELGIPDDAVEPYGRHKAKIGLDFIDTLESRPDGALVLVTGISPTPAGEGKTTTTVGLGDALNRIGKTTRDLPARTQPGPLFRDEGRRGRRRICAGRADGRDQPALHRRLPRHHRRPTICWPR